MLLVCAVVDNLFIYVYSLLILFHNVCLLFFIIPAFYVVFICVLSMCLYVYYFLFIVLCVRFSVCLFVYSYVLIVCLVVFPWFCYIIVLVFFYCFVFMLCVCCIFLYRCSLFSCSRSFLFY